MSIGKEMISVLHKKQGIFLCKLQYNIIKTILSARGVYSFFHEPLFRNIHKIIFFEKMIIIS